MAFIAPLIRAGNAVCALTAMRRLNNVSQEHRDAAKQGDETMHVHKFVINYAAKFTNAQKPAEL